MQSQTAATATSETTAIPSHGRSAAQEPAAAPAEAALPKRAADDYSGIDFTFGFFTAVDFMAKEVQNLRADAIATSGYYIIETMGRKAGWLSYGVAIAGEANLVIAPEDIGESLRSDGILDLDKLAVALTA